MRFFTFFLYWVRAAAGGRLAGAGVLGCLATGRVAAQTEVLPTPITPATGTVAIYGVSGGVVMPLSQRVGLVATGLCFWGDQRGGLSLLNVPVRLNRYVTVTPGYFGIYLPPTPAGRRLRDNRVRVAVTFTLPLRGLYLSDRNLVERRFQQEGRTSTRYHNVLRAEDSLRLGRLHFTVYAANEAFYDWSVPRWTRDHLSLGLTYPFAHHLTADFSYARQWVWDAPDGNSLVLGITVLLDRPRLFTRQAAH